MSRAIICVGVEGELVLGVRLERRAVDVLFLRQKKKGLSELRQEDRMGKVLIIP